MKALVLDKPGKLDALRITDISVPVPGPGEVRVKVESVGLNPVDYKLADSGYPEWEYPFILGLDVAGTIESLGEAVLDWKVGDDVFYHGDLSRPGGYAEYAMPRPIYWAQNPRLFHFPKLLRSPVRGLQPIRSCPGKFP